MHRPYLLYERLESSAAAGATTTGAAAAGATTTGAGAYELKSERGGRAHKRLVVAEKAHLLVAHCAKFVNFMNFVKYC
eukprot:SAG11_NODE_505_length_8888_cov_12.479235_1_plen_78_part_00